MSEEDKRLWERVCATVRKLGEKIHPTPTSKPLVPEAIPHNPRVIDLHGKTVQEAYDATVDFLANTQFKAVIVITGKSGQIRQEFPRWMEKLGYLYVIKSNGGAFSVNTTRRITQPPR